MSHYILIAAAIINDASGSTLLVRKRGTTAFMQAGGKIDGDETASEALTRELMEELGLDIASSPADFVGRLEAPAANEPDCTVIADIFRLTVQRAKISAKAEIEEIVWIDPAHPPQIEMAPLTRDHILSIA